MILTMALYTRNISDAILDLIHFDSGIRKPLIVSFHSDDEMIMVRNCLKEKFGVISVDIMDCYPHDKGYASLNEELIRLENHPEISRQFFPPAAYKGKEDTAKCFLFYFRGTGQLQPEYISYCKRLFEEIPLPIIYLVNDYSDDPTNALKDDFFEHIDVSLETEDVNPAYEMLRKCKEEEK